MWLPWDIAAIASVGLAALGVLVRPVRRHRVAAAAVARETALVLALYALWQLAGTLSVMQVNGAIGRATWIWHAERFLHLPSELSLQRAVLPHPWLVQACNGYYAIAHVPALIVFLIWLFARHRDRYPPVRNTLALLTGASLLVQLAPVAPPRMLGGLGFVDTGLQYGQSVYTALGSGAADQLSAMPSVHVGWAVLIGVAVVQISPSRWRWLVLAHPVLTAIVVAATANHWWLDGLVAVALMAVAVVAQRWARTTTARRLPVSVTSDADMGRAA
jgi:hypothetical protein